MTAAGSEGAGGVLDRLREAGLAPRKCLGQHFLFDRNILAAIVEDAGIRGTDRVFEVGTGAGTLTRELARRAGEVLTVEVDARMLAFARGELRSFSNIRFLQGDVLDGHARLRTDVREALEGLGPFAWVSNLPYGIATPLIVDVCESGLPWSGATLTVQAEVADRILAAAGEDAYGPLSALVAYWADARGGRRIPPGAFWPPPRVDSRVLHLTHRTALGTGGEYRSFRAWVKALFSCRRKQLRKLLKDKVGEAQAVRVLSSTGWCPSRRPETLSPAEFLALARLCHPPDSKIRPHRLGGRQANPSGPGGP